MLIFFAWVRTTQSALFYHIQLTPRVICDVFCGDSLIIHRYTIQLKYFFRHVCFHLYIVCKSYQLLTFPSFVLKENLKLLERISQRYANFDTVCAVFHEVIQVCSILIGAWHQSTARAIWECTAPYIFDLLSRYFDVWRRQNCAWPATWIQTHVSWQLHYLRVGGWKEQPF